jgi:glycosyltransferase involved in cell wall biosynthesis
MRVLYASERPPYPFFLGGAARAAHILLLRMASISNVVCEAVGSRDYSFTPWSIPDAADHLALGIRSLDSPKGDLDCGYRICLLPDFLQSLVAEIERFRPDLVWAQLEGALPVLQTASRLGVRGLCFVHDAEFDPAEMRAIAALDCHLVASSAFLAEKVRRATGRRAEVVYPPAELYFDTPGNPDGLVTMINPHPVKGLDTFIDIARRLPSVAFLLQESWRLDEAAIASLRERLVELPNVRFAQRVSDMRSVYRQTRLLIAPSRWEEGFGMVALEAQSCGIPVIASRRGGLPEAVGDGGVLIDDYLNADVWVNAIETILRDAGRYMAFARRARCHAASDTFAPEVLARRLYGIARSEPMRSSRFARAVFEAQRRVHDWPLFGRLIRRRAG